MEYKNLLEQKKVSQEKRDGSNFSAAGMRYALKTTSLSVKLYALLDGGTMKMRKLVIKP